MDERKYDLIIIGAGPSGIFMAYELIKLGSNKKVLIIEQGKKVEERFCPIEKTGRCIKCKPLCHITNGFSGAGAFSDGKLSLSKDVGGWLEEYIGAEKLSALIKYVDDIYLSYGGNKEISFYFSSQHLGETLCFSWISQVERYVGLQR